MELLVSTLVSPSTGSSREERPPLLYLPGMDGTGDLFYRQAQLLQQEFRIRPLSLNHPESGDSWEALADWVGSQMEGGAYLCGESFGACLALQVATRWPQRCRGLILVNPASSLRRGPLWLAGRFLLPFLPPGLYRTLSERGLGFLAELNQMEPEDREQLRRAVHSVDQEVAAHRLALLGSFAVDELPLESLALPTLLVAGGRDRLLPSVNEVRRLAERLPQVQVEISPSSGHACLLERQMNLRRYLLKRDGVLAPTLFSASGTR
ncbi:alpha/beta hydrolase [Synechococcus bigranulatus str. 'Rupite']|uniref:Alpha/beta hydrolase n=1 Tax=Thermostichus vulcanus str. 'Rupite' TaxID=2813851 RepID=A0ABT0CDD7_THEVL|nr:alpha/beta hydrolase [Thermostichus vulcanus str. 'Rupite']